MKNYDEFYRDLKTLISFNSEQSEPLDGMPFGKGVADTMNAFVAIAKRMGFEVKTYDGYAAEVIYGNGEEIGIMGHLDVVPAGKGWNTPPFELTEKDGVLYGRGVCDDKGPTLATLYALKELKDSGLPCNKKFRFFAGGNEETGWQDVAYLKTKTKLPEYGFSPDGNFPVSYSEKGVFWLFFPLPEFKNFYDLNGGTVINAVCAEASVKTKIAPDAALLKKYGLTEKNGVIYSKGKSAHGSVPQNGVNAFKALFAYMNDCGEKLSDFCKYLFNDETGIMRHENEQGNLTFSPDVLKEKDGKICLTCDCRVPAPMNFEKDVKPLFDKLGMEWYYSEKHEPFLVPKDCEFVRTLADSYNQATGEHAEPVKMNGSTFARAFEQGCSFGFEFHGVDTHIHEPNEEIRVENLLKAYDIIKVAIFNLAK